MPRSTPSRPDRATAPRRPIPAVLVLLLAGLLAGCQVQVDAGIALQPDDTAVVDLDIGVRFTEELPPELTGGQDPADALSEEDAREGIDEAAASCGFDPALASVERLETEEGFLGVSILLDGIPIEAVNCFFSEDSDTPFFSQFEITRDGDEYVFTAAVEDLSQGMTEGLGGGLGGQKRVAVQAESTELPTDLQSELGAQELDAFGEAFGEGFAEALANPEDLFDITIRVTFPGEVLESNATTVDGTTAIWELDGQQTTLMARGEASDGGGLGGVLPLLIAALAVLIGLALVIFLVVRSRRGKVGQAAPGAPPGAPGYAAGGPAGAPPAGVPQWGQLPGQQGDPSQAPPPSQPQWGQQPPPPQGPPPSQPQWGAHPGQPQPGQPQPQPPAPEWGAQPGVPGQQPTAPGEHPGAVGGDSAPPSHPPGEEGGGSNPDATRTFRPEDLLPPRDEDR